MTGSVYAVGHQLVVPRFVPATIAPEPAATMVRRVERPLEAAI